MSEPRNRRARPARVSADVLPIYENWPEERKAVEAIDAHTAMLAETNKSLATLATCASETLGFFRKIVKVYIPYGVAAAAIIWPAIGKIIQGLPPWPG